MDITSRALKQPGTETMHSLHSTTPGSVLISPGGVGRNIAEATHRILSKKSCSQPPVLVSLIGEDIIGRVLQDELSRIGMRTDGLIPNPGKASAVCNMVMDAGGGLIAGVADMHIIESLEGKVVSIYILRKSIITSTLIHVGYQTVESVQPESSCNRWQSEEVNNHRYRLALHWAQKTRYNAPHSITHNQTNRTRGSLFRTNFRPQVNEDHPLDFCIRFFKPKRRKCPDRFRLSQHTRIEGTLARNSVR